MNDYSANSQGAIPSSLLAIAHQIPATCMGLHIRRASRILTQVYDAALRPAGLAMNQFTLLVAIHLFEAVPITQLAQELFTDQTTVTRNIKLLEKRGLVVINPGADRRIAIAIFPFTSQKAITMGYHSRSWVAFLNPTYKLAITLK